MFYIILSVLVKVIKKDERRLGKINELNNAQGRG